MVHQTHDSGRDLPEPPIEIFQLLSRDNNIAVNFDPRFVAIQEEDLIPEVHDFEAVALDFRTVDSDFDHIAADAVHIDPVGDLGRKTVDGPVEDIVVAVDVAVEYRMNHLLHDWHQLRLSVKLYDRADAFDVKRICKM